MAVTAGEVARSALADLGDDSAGLLNVLRWVGERYSQLANRRLKQLRQIGEVVIPAAVSAGTITIARGDERIVGDATAKAAWSSALAGRFFRTRGAWYEIASYNS